MHRVWMPLAILTLLIIAVTLAVWNGKRQWFSYSTSLIQLLNQHQILIRDQVNLSETEALPAPVKRYFNFVLEEGLPIINHTFLIQTGGFRANPEQSHWSTMNAQQHFSSQERGFVWDATISIIPGISINAIDSYINGKSHMKGKLLSLFTLIDVKNKKQLDEGALQRYLAEAVWFPTALLPSQGVTWSPINDYRAKATITDHDSTASLEFEFNEKGEAVTVFTSKRYREVSGRYEATPWLGRFSDYIYVDGYRVPQKGEVEWQLEEMTYPYWKGELISIKYQ